MVLGALEVAGRHRPQVAGNVVVAGGEGDEGAFLDHHDHRIGDRLGGEAVLGRGFEAEHVAFQMKAADLATAVAEELVGPDRSRDDLVDIVGGFALAVDLGIAVETDGGAHQGKGVGQGG